MWKTIQSNLINLAVVLGVFVAYMPETLPIEIPIAASNVAAFMVWALLLSALFTWLALMVAFRKAEIYEAHPQAVYRLATGKGARRNVSIFWSLMLAAALAAAGNFVMATISLAEMYFEGLAIASAKEAQAALLKAGKAWVPPVPEAANDRMTDDEWKAWSDTPPPLKTPEEAARAAMSPEEAREFDEKYGNPRGSNRKVA